MSEGFPRITELPEGLGNINYSLVVAAVNDFAMDRDEYLVMIKRAFVMTQDEIYDF